MRYGLFSVAKSGKFGYLHSHEPLTGDASVFLVRCPLHHEA